VTHMLSNEHTSQLLHLATEINYNMIIPVVGIIEPDHSGLLYCLE